MRTLKDLKSKLDKYYNPGSSFRNAVARNPSEQYEYDFLREIYNYMVKYGIEEDPMRIGLENAMKWMVNGNSNN